MKSSTTESFRKQLAALSPDIQKMAGKKFRLWAESPHHPSLRFKKVGDYWSVRISRSYRALGLEREGAMIWFFIGTHGDYEKWL